MCDRRAALAALLAPTALLALVALPVLAEPASVSAEPIDLPFRVTAMRGPGSEVALAVATSGLLPVARAGASADPKLAPKAVEGPRPVVVVWGEGGGAVIHLDGESLRTTLVGAEAIEGFAAAETPRGAVPGSRVAQDGPLSAYLTGPTRALGDAPGQAAGLTIRERQPIGVTAEPKAVPVATRTLTPGSDQVFAGRAPRIASLDGRPAVIAVTVQGASESSLVVATKEKDAGWNLTARTPPQAGTAPLSVAGIATFSGAGSEVATVRTTEGGGELQLWRLAGSTLTQAGAWPGYAGPDAGEAASLAALLPGEPASLVLPLAGRTALAVLSLKGGAPAERWRIPLPAPAAHGIAALSPKKILVGLADGRLAAATVAP
ncbi:hypothetical protein ASG52_16990 [Methylobacterium sp. Leaf456]|uniref:hypothetical protein n=1 Tax=Methylobacterium sp. Leaf456 TaxID=1736382 RepID=UPI0006F5D175|nr:hypothetical protein [Methylobacterium sp. Leaf456]KQT60941.1 hypothetical protein ASG52_16990 [Methylobacterium sp. Leaf456]